MTRRRTLLAALVLVFTVSNARAVSPYEPDVAGAVTSIGLSLTFCLTTRLLLDIQPRNPRVTPDDTPGNALDRWVVGNESNGADIASDVLLITLAAGPLIADAVDIGVHGDTFGAWSVDTVVYMEAQAINVALTELVKLAVQRPRPYMYATRGEAHADHPMEAHLSFWSGHTSIAFTSAVA